MLSLSNLLSESGNPRSWSYSAGSLRKRKKPCVCILTFHKSDTNSKGIDDRLKCYMFKKGLKQDCMFWKKLRLKGACKLSDLLNRAQFYINYEEELLDKEGRRSRSREL